MGTTAQDIKKQASVAKKKRIFTIILKGINQF